MKTAMEIHDNREELGSDLEGDIIEYFRAENPVGEDRIRRSINDYVRIEDPTNHYALKVLHSPNDARNYEDAEERIRRELEAMKEVPHPNLLKVEDYDPDEKWFVSRYYPGGTLESRSGDFTGQVERVLTAIRPVVAGVSLLHQKGLVHRDIKPENIFVDGDGQLVLGDFGLVFFTGGDRTRLSGTAENVGSYDWMPPWAMGVRLEDINPTFDVFALGKTIWSMVSKTSTLRFWYHRRPEFDVERMFSRDPQMVFLNELLDKCIVENEEDCCKDATDLCVRIDKILRAIKLGATPIGEKYNRPCRVCGFGGYQLLAGQTSPFDTRTATTNFGLEPKGANSFRIFSCNHCGHVQLFFSENGSNPQAWDDASSE